MKKSKRHKPAPKTTCYVSSGSERANLIFMEYALEQITKEFEKSSAATAKRLVALKNNIRSHRESMTEALM